MRPVHRMLSLALAASVAFSQTASAFCGFYVATGNSPLINKASQVVLAHEGNTTRVTMASDVMGDPKQFGLVIPVPTVIKREQVKILKPETVAHLAEYTKPRLVEYHDEDPCPPERGPMATMAPSMMAAPATAIRRKYVQRESTVRIEAQYSVDEYDIIVLTATRPDDLVSYLNQNGYKVPPGAVPTVGSYLKQGMHFFLAKVNMAKMKSNNPTGFLRPIQVTYQSPKFMLPIRLGTANADGPQDMIVMALTRKGRLETVNYPTVKVPTDAGIPVFVGQRFGQFYDDLFARQVKANSGTAFLEYAWDLGNCDPCSAPPMANEELRALGATWLAQERGQQAFVTRLHVRYDVWRFPEDLVLHETSDNQSFQARYVMNHPFTGNTDFRAGREYKASLPDRFRKEAVTLQALTGWDMAMIRQRMAATGQPLP